MTSTVAGIDIASYGVLADRLARSRPRTTHDVSGSISVRFAGSPTAIGRP